jgi:beta-lactamase class A
VVKACPTRWSYRRTIKPTAEVWTSPIGFDSVWAPVSAVAEAVALMMQLSDNAATTALIRHVG